MSSLKLGFSVSGLQFAMQLFINTRIESDEKWPGSEYPGIDTTGSYSSAVQFIRIQKMLHALKNTRECTV
jgi:hypothetical protein